MRPSHLSKADSQVLAQIFDPENATAGAEVLVDPNLRADRYIQSQVILSQLRAREKKAIALIERFENDQPDDDSKEVTFKSALAILDDVLAKYPDYASARNNRAQLRRWRYGDSRILVPRAEDSDGVIASAGLAIIQDLTTAISLASPTRPQDAISPSQGRLLANSYTQLAAVYLSASKGLGKTSMEVGLPQFEGWNPERFEEEASRLFHLGGIYGNEVAKFMAIRTNPHAKLCGSIVKDAMRREIVGAR